MLPPADLQTADALRRRLDAGQLAWLGKYFTEASAGANGESASARVTVLYGTQSGNGRALAASLAGFLQNAGLRADAVSMADYKTANLKKERFLCAVISTHGEGDPPDSAAEFFAFLQSARAPRLAELRYAVLALGDSSYEYFCKSGRDLEKMLSALGANSFLQLTECDADFEEAANAWRERACDSLAGLTKKENGENGYSVPAFNINGNGITVAADAAPVWSRENPFSAEVLANIKLSGEGRDVRHLEFSLAGSGLRPAPGDSVGVFPQNREADALRLCDILRLPPEKEITIGANTVAASEWLRGKLDIARLTPAVLQKYSAVCNAERLRELCGARAKAAEYCAGRGFADLLADFPPPRESGADALKCLRRMTPRLYSLASAREDEAHLLIADASFYDNHQRLRRGVCSAYLSSLSAGESARVFVQSNEEFRLPEHTAPILMIGAGSGIAPYRAFMEEREERGAGGKSWLFFGERRRRDDFYYQREWLARLGGGLTKMNAAFSRDINEKTNGGENTNGSRRYVQHELRENAEQVREWMEEGGYVYVCGDEKRMAKDVDAELAQIAGAELFARLKKERRYRRDVY